jgi:hypothetical protein
MTGQNKLLCLYDFGLLPNGFRGKRARDNHEKVNCWKHIASDTSQLVISLAVTIELTLRILGYHSSTDHLDFNLDISLDP